MGNARKSDENRFVRMLKKAFTRLIAKIKSEPSKPLEEQLNEFTNTREVDRFIDKVSRDMITCQREETAKTWRDAAEKASRGREIFQALKTEMRGPVGDLCRMMVADNANYIKTLPQEWAKYVTAYVFREAMRGRRPEAVEKELRKILPEKISRNLKCIVRTEMAKASAAITQARAEDLGISAYIWHAAMDERTRHAHAGMDGLLVFYNNPPNPEELFPESGVKPYGRYHAGNTFNCRCWQEPIVEWSFLPDSIRVVTGDGVKTMTRQTIIHRYS